MFVNAYNISERIPQELVIVFAYEVGNRVAVGKMYNSQ